MFGLPWWVFLLTVAGALATVTALISLFFAFGRRPERMWTDHIGEIGSDEFLIPLAAILNVPFRHGGRAFLLNNGDAFFTAMLEDFHAAQRSINFMAYIWEPGKVSERVFEELIERAHAGIQVRVLLDGFGSLMAPKRDVEALIEAGGKVAIFRPPVLSKLWRFHRRNHRRAIVIDGRVAYTGGAAVGDKWIGDARNSDEWRDSMTRVTGCLAQNLQSAFAEPWAFCTGEVLTGDSFFPTDLDDGHTEVLSVGVISSPYPEEHPLRLFFFLTFLAARKRLWIASPYFVPDKHTREVVKRRARAGVDVRIMMPDSHTDAKPIRAASHSYYTDMLNAGVRIFEYQQTMMHLKHVVVDGKWSVVGSANMDIRSKELNEENVLGVLDEDFAQQLERTFERDLQQCKEIVRAEWRKRGPGARIMERICVLFAEQY
jgi:cardiolipin synthase A/B